MQLLDTRRGVQHFTFEHHREYQQVQFKFLDAVESMDPNNIVVRWAGRAVPSCVPAAPFPGSLGWCILVELFGLEKL